MIKLNQKEIKLKEFDSEFKKNSKEFEKLNKILNSPSNKRPQMTDWIDWDVQMEKKEFNTLNTHAKSLSKKVDKLVVVGIGGSFLGAKSALDFFLGKKVSNDKVLFVGIDISANHYQQVIESLKGFKWGICVISKSGTTLEASLAFRFFKSLLEKQVGEKKAKDLIVAVTDGKKGVLREMSDKEGYQTFVVPDGIGGRFSVFTPVGLYPLAFAGINIAKFIEGLTSAKKKYLKGINNDAYKYGLSRYLHFKKGMTTEIFATYDYDSELLMEWIKQLFGESEGKNNKGLLSTSVIYTRDLHSLGQFIQEGNKKFIETTIYIENNNIDLKIPKDKKNLDDVNKFTGKSLNEITEVVFKSVYSAHAKEGNVPSSIIYIKDKSEKSLAEFMYFMFITVYVTSTLLKVNTFDQPGVEVYKRNVKTNLG